MTYPTESQEQIWLFEWAELLSTQYPELSLLHHIPNGGLRAKVTAVRLKAEGVKPGVPDLFLPVARKGYHGLYIEMKAIKGKLSMNQLTWIEALKKQGYHVMTCYGFNEAANVISDYMGIKK